MPRQVMKPDRVREVPAWTADDVRTFLAAIKDVAGSLDAHVVLEPVLPRPVPCRRLELGAESCGFRDAPRPERAIR
jgi:hypothetical protein